MKSIDHSDSYFDTDSDFWYSDWLSHNYYCKNYNLNLLTIEIDYNGDYMIAQQLMTIFFNSKSLNFTTTGKEWS